MTDRAPDNIVKFKEESVRLFKERLLASGPISDAEFADVVYLATTQFGVGEEKFRAAFGLTAGAVDRWTTLKNLPQPSIRTKIFKWMHDELQPKN